MTEVSNEKNISLKQVIHVYQLLLYLLTYSSTDCGDPTPGDGTAITDSGTSYGQTADLTCNQGYTLTGDTTVTCQATGTWSGAATCTVQGNYL